MSGHAIHRLEGHGGKTSDLYTNLECLSPSSYPLVKDVSVISNPLLWSEVVPQSDVLSGARLGTTRLYCLEAAGGLMYCVCAESRSRGSACHPWQDGQ